MPAAVSHLCIIIDRLAKGNDRFTSKVRSHPKRCHDFIPTIGTVNDMQIAPIIVHKVVENLAPFPKPGNCIINMLDICM